MTQSLVLLTVIKNITDAVTIIASTVKGWSMDLVNEAFKRYSHSQELPTLTFGVYDSKLDLLNGFESVHSFKENQEYASGDSRYYQYAPDKFVATIKDYKNYLLGALWLLIMTCITCFLTKKCLSDFASRQSQRQQPSPCLGSVWFVEESPTRRPNLKGRARTAPPLRRRRSARIQRRNATAVALEF